MYEHRPRLSVPLLAGVGAAFDFIAGTAKQSPVWMQENGLEWFFRLTHEPRRLCAMAAGAHPRPRRTAGAVARRPFRSTRPPGFDRLDSWNGIPGRRKRQRLRSTQTFAPFGIRV